MRKIPWKPSTMLYPVPAVLVTCREKGGRANIITIAWAGTICSEPPMLSISVRPERHSHAIIEATGEFVVNIPTAAQAETVDWCGVVSGRDTDKFRARSLTAVPAATVEAPLIAECPLHLECRVTEARRLGSHTLFIAEVTAVQASETLMETNGRFALEKAGLLAYAHGHYYELGRQIGHFGFSVRKKQDGTDTKAGKSTRPAKAGAPHRKPGPKKSAPHRKDS